jgi:PadR family transcriptional regulator, regulatory protein AphA
MDTKTLCLGVLNFGDASGYEIKKLVELSFGHFLGVSYGSIYPALAELNREGLIECTVVAQDSRPDKKIYTLTETGKGKLREDLMGCPVSHKVRSEFLFVLCFAHLLTPDRLNGILENQVEDFERKIRGSQQWLDKEDLPPGIKFAAGFGKAVMTAAVEYIRRNAEAIVPAGGNL